MMNFMLEKIGAFFTKIVDWFYFPFLHFMPREVYRYAATGGANTALDIFLYFIVYNFVLQKQVVDFGLVAVSPHIAAFLFVFPLTFLTGFFLAKYVTFSTSHLKGRIQLFRYGVVVFGSIILNYICLKFFVEYCHISPTPSKMITTVIVVAYSYIAQRYYTFKTGGKHKDIPQT